MSIARLKSRSIDTQHRGDETVRKNIKSVCDFKSIPNLQHLTEIGENGDTSKNASKKLSLKLKRGPKKGAKPFRSDWQHFFECIYCALKHRGQAPIDITCINFYSLHDYILFLVSFVVPCCQLYVPHKNTFLVSGWRLVGFRSALVGFRSAPGCVNSKWLEQHHHQQRQLPPSISCHSQPCTRFTCVNASVCVTFACVGVCVTAL